VLKGFLMGMVAVAECSIRELIISVVEEVERVEVGVELQLMGATSTRVVVAPL
jgi:hypothetical protein